MNSAMRECLVRAVQQKEPHLVKSKRDIDFVVKMLAVACKDQILWRALELATEEEK